MVVQFIVRTLGDADAQLQAVRVVAQLQGKVRDGSVPLLEERKSFRGNSTAGPRNPLHFDIAAGRRNAVLRTV